MKQYNGGIIVWGSLASDYAMINMAGERKITNVMLSLLCSYVTRITRIVHPKNVVGI